MLNCSFKKTTDLCVCACELSRTHTHTELWGSPWGPDWEQGAMVAMAAAAPLLHHHSFSVFHCFYPFFLLLSSLLPADVFVSRCIQIFPQCFVKRSVQPQVANTHMSAERSNASGRLFCVGQLYWNTICSERLGVEGELGGGGLQSSRQQQLKQFI